MTNGKEVKKEDAVEANEETEDLAKLRREDPERVICHVRRTYIKTLESVFIYFLLGWSASVDWVIDEEN